MNGNDVRVLESGRGLRLPGEALEGMVVVRQLRPQYLQGYRTVEALLVRLQDDAHPPAAQKANDPVRPQLGQARRVYWLLQNTTGDEPSDLVTRRLQVPEESQMPAQVVREFWMLPDQIRFADRLSASLSVEEVVEDLADAKIARVLSGRFATS
ncbi:MAG: hypothetical protein WBE26_12070 [Phycisphaerae bacterium]